MKTFLLTLVMMSAAVSHAEFYGFVDRAKAELRLASGKFVTKIDIAQFQSFDLRQKTATLYSKMGTLSVFNDRGEALLKDAFGSQAQISDSVIAVTTPGNYVRVYTIQGQKIYKSAYALSAQVSNSGFALRNLNNQSFEVYNSKGELVWQDQLIKRAWMNDSVILTEGTTGTYFLRNWKNAEVINSYINVTAVSLNDQLMAITMNDGWLRVVNASGEEIFNVANPAAYQLMNGGFWYEQSGITFLLDNRAEQKVFMGSEKVVLSSNRFIATKNIAGNFIVYRRDGKGLRIFPLASVVALADDSFALRYGSNQVVVYDDHFLEKKDYQYPDLLNFGVSNSLFWAARRFLDRSEFNLIPTDRTVRRESMLKDWVSDVQLSTTRVDQNWGEF